MNKKISIIVPVFNAEKTLDKCIMSLINQIYRNIEIILINDGSKDDSLSICQKYAEKDKRITVINKLNGGVSSARNEGLDNATGEFVMFCDSDDWAEPNWCIELISHYEQGCLIMGGHFVEGKQTYFPYKVCAQNKIERYSRKEIRKLKLKFFSAPWNKIFNRNIINNEGIRFDTEITNGEDYL